MNYCIEKDISARELATNANYLKPFQQKLLRQDQSMLNVVNEDPNDLARKATATASAETSDGPASAAIDGINRNIEDGKSHQWQAPMNGGQPWLELKWSSPQQVNTVELTFDTGLHRFLRISGQAVVMKGQVRGPQPETISDYKVEGLLNGKVVHTAFASGNYYRKVSHKFDRIRIDTLRLTVISTHGDDLARVFEVRCYNE